MTFILNRVFSNLQDDARDRQAALDQIQHLPPHGHLWPLVGARRSGKTWTLQALERHLNQNEPGCASYKAALSLDFQLDSLPEVRYLLLDEPYFAAEGGRDITAFLEWCARRHEKKTRIIVAMSPAEWKCLLQVGKGTGNVSRKDLLYVEPLTPTESRRVARRIPWAEQILAEPGLPEGWAASPYLLELLFWLAERRPEADRRVTPEFLQLALMKCDEQEDTAYFPSMFVNGLDKEQRRLIRQVARGDSPDLGEDEVLVRCGLLKRHDGRCTVADPVLRALVTPLRIHHLSDIHVGPKSALHGDDKEPGSHGERFARAAGVGLTREKYREHLEQLSARSEAPHLLIISGDIVETGAEDQLEQARAYVERLKGTLGAHPLLEPDAERVLLAGGNHDVDWGEAQGTAGARKRHLALAKHFEGFKRPRLEEPPASRELAVAGYPRLGLEVLLLGSAEFGGEHEKAPEWMDVLELLDRLRRDALAEKDHQKAQAIRERISRLDPGLVEDADLQRVKARRWRMKVRIAVLHHPVSPMPGTEIAKFSGLLNAGAVKETLLREKFCLVLHGHAHKGWFGKEQWPGEHDWTLRIAAAPSLASKEVQEQHGFNQIEISRLREEGPEEYLVTVQRYVFNGSSWAPGRPMRFRPGQPGEEL